jgi:hypothetical protein
MRLERKVYDVLYQPGLQIRALPVPGGLLIITDSYEESGNGPVFGLTQTFLRMSHSEIVEFLGLE